MPQNGSLRPIAPVTSWAARYGQVILRDGIAAIPSALYRYQGALDLSAQEVWFIAAILAHKWDADLPHPSLKRLAEQCGGDLRWLKRLRAGLCAKALLAVYEHYDEQGRQGSNRYDFGALFARLEALIATDPPTPNAIQAEDAPPALAPDRDSSFVARYGRVIAGAGVAAVPQALFTHQAALELTPQQIRFVCYILAHRWSADLPHPSLVRMAERTGYSRRQLQVIKDELVARGYLQVVPRTGAGGGKDSNGYDFSGLLDAISVQLQHIAAATASEPPLLAPGPPAPGRSPRRGRQHGIARDAQPADPERVGGSILHRGGGSSVHNQAGSTPHREGGSILHREGGTTLHNGEGSTLHRGEGSTSHRGGGSPVNRPGAHSLHGRGEGSAQGRGVVAAHEEEPVSKEPHQKRDDSNRFAPADEAADDDHPPYSPYIAGVVLDLSRELGDPHAVSNVTQALRLWQASGLGEAAFVDALRTAKLAVRKAQAHGVANKGAYWFRTLRDQLGLAAAGAAY